MSGCDDAYAAWGSGRGDLDALSTGTIVLPDGTECPLDAVPDAYLLPAVVTVPASQPVRAPREKQMAGGGDLWLTLLLSLGVVVGILGLTWSLPWLVRRGIEHRREKVMTPAPMTPDEELMATVTGTGPPREPNVDARVAAADLTGEDGLRGDLEPASP